MVFNPKPEGGHKESGPLDLYKIYNDLMIFFKENSRFIEGLKNGTNSDCSFLKPVEEILKILIEKSDGGHVYPHILHRLSKEEQEEIRRVVISRENPQNPAVLGIALEKFANTIRMRIEGDKRERRKGVV